MNKYMDSKIMSLVKVTFMAVYRLFRFNKKCLNIGCKNGDIIEGRNTLRLPKSLYSNKHKIYLRFVRPYTGVFFPKLSMEKRIS